MQHEEINVVAISTGTGQELFQFNISTRELLITILRGIRPKTNLFGNVLEIGVRDDRWSEVFTALGEYARNYRIKCEEEVGRLATELLLIV